MPSSAILFSAILVLSCGQTYRITDRMTEADDRYTHATIVSVSNKPVNIHGDCLVGFLFIYLVYLMLT